MRGDSNAYSANQAYHMLSQEVYTFADDYRNAKREESRYKACSTGQQPEPYRCRTGKQRSNTHKPRGQQHKNVPVKLRTGPRRQAPRRREAGNGQPEFLLFLIYPVEAGSGAVYCPCFWW